MSLENVGKLPPRSSLTSPGEFTLKSGVDGTQGGVSRHGSCLCEAHQNAFPVEEIEMRRGSIICHGCHWNVTQACLAPFFCFVRSPAMSDFLCLHLSLGNGRDDSPQCLLWMEKQAPRGCVTGPGDTGSQDKSSGLWGTLFDVPATMLTLRETKGERTGPVPSDGL